MFLSGWETSDQSSMVQIKIVVVIIVIMRVIHIIWHIDCRDNERYPVFSLDSRVLTARTAEINRIWPTKWKPWYLINYPSSYIHWRQVYFRFIIMRLGAGYYVTICTNRKFFSIFESCDSRLSSCCWQSALIIIIIKWSANKAVSVVESNNKFLV
jgi:hypothetical protein